MTRSTNARVAGVAYLAYIAVALPDMVLMGRATDAEGTPARLALLASHAADARLATLLGLASCFAALVLAVSLYGVTREQDHELAMFALVCRGGEGIIGSLNVLGTVGLLWLATGGAASAAESAGSTALGAMLFRIQGWNTDVSATFFAVGSTVFSWLMLRGRMIPSWLAWLGVASSALLVVVLPLHLAGVARGAVAQLVWLPIAVFELTVAPWLIIKGVPERRAPPAIPA